MRGIMNLQLTQRQQEVFEFICKQNIARRPPTVRDVMEQFGFTSPNAVTRYTRKFVEAGLVEPANNRFGIRLTEAAMKSAIEEPTLDGVVSAAVGDVFS